MKYHVRLCVFPHIPLLHQTQNGNPELILKKSFLTDIFSPYNALLPMTSMDWPLRAAHPCALRSILSLRLSFCVPPFALFMPTHQNIRSKFNISTMSWPGNVGSSVESHFLIPLLLRALRLAIV